MPENTDAERRDRYAAAISERLPDDLCDEDLSTVADAAMAVADAEQAMLRKQLDHCQKRRAEVGVESRRRGKEVLARGETIRAMEREIDALQRQLGAEILRANTTEGEQPQPVSPARARAEAALKDAAEAAHLHAMHGMKRTFHLCRQWGATPIPPAEVLNALGLDQNANTVDPEPSAAPHAVDRCTCRQAVHTQHHTPATPVPGCPWCAEGDPR